METFTHMVNGAEIRFAHLTLYDVFGDPEKTEVNGFVPKFQERRKVKREANLTRLGFSKEQVLVELEGIDNEDVDVGTFLKFFKENPVHHREIVEFSYRQANHGAALPEGVNVAAVLWELVAPLGIVPSAADPEPGQPPAGYGEPGGQQNPTIPPTYSVTAGAMAPTIPEP